jgi:hypothetical protein
MRASVIGGHDVLYPIAQRVFVPPVLAEELLQRPRCDTRFQSYWFDALLGQIRELPSHVHTQMGTCILATEAIGVPIEELSKFSFQFSKLFGVHAVPSVSPWKAGSLASRTDCANTNLAL